MDTQKLLTNVTNALADSEGYSLINFPFLAKQSGFFDVAFFYLRAWILMSLNDFALFAVIGLKTGISTSLKH